MPPPTAAQITVATQALRSEATVWDGQVCEINRVWTAAENLRLTRIEAGLFQLIVNEHETIIDLFVARGTEGATRMAEIAKTLRLVADTYDREEADNTHLLTSIY
jgi:hypothetical protein